MNRVESAVNPKIKKFVGEHTIVKIRVFIASIELHNISIDCIDNNLNTRRT